MSDFFEKLFVATLVRIALTVTHHLWIFLSSFLKGKLISVYLGKEYNRDVFKEKILKKQKKTGLV